MSGFELLLACKKMSVAHFRAESRLRSRFDGVVVGADATMYPAEG
jgi:hypothetical protein